MEEACVLEAGEASGALDCLAQRLDALGSVGATVNCVEATQRIVGEAAGNEDAHSALLADDTKASTRHKVFQALGGVGAAHFRVSIWVLPSTAAMALPPATPMRQYARLYSSDRPI